MRHWFSKALIGVSVLVSTVTLVTWLGEFHWFLDLFSHFKLQYLCAIILCMVSAVLLSKYKVILVLTPFLILNAIDIVPLYTGGNKSTQLSSSIKINSINLLSSNRDFNEVGQYINSKNADILIFLEVTSIWEHALDSMLISYPHRMVVARLDNFGIALYSKVKLSELRTIDFGNAEVPSLMADMKVGNKTLTILATHPPPPTDEFDFKFQDHQFEEIEKYAGTISNEFMVIGDLNLSSFSNRFKRLIKNSKLIDSRKGFGVLPSWPSWFPLMNITLDHCLVSQGLKIKTREVGGYVGSDHLPIFVEIGVE